MLHDAHSSQNPYDEVNQIIKHPTIPNHTKSSYLNRYFKLHSIHYATNLFHLLFDYEKEHFL